VKGTKRYMWGASVRYSEGRGTDREKGAADTYRGLAAEGFERRMLPQRKGSTQHRKVGTENREAKARFTLRWW